MASKFKIFDPLWSKQWHLVNGVMPENSINVTGVWEQGIVGKGVNVAIVDDGLDMHSDDLAANFVRPRLETIRLVEINRISHSTPMARGTTTTTPPCPSRALQTTNTVRAVQAK
jgi:subtilisin family serine protease